jgi:putative restriction endonuclease
LFASRRELHDAGIHRGLQQGIGAKGEAIVLAGGYVDDEDYGDVIIYTGEGGRDLRTGRQVEDQTLTRGNLALAKNYKEGIPIRVSRGNKHNSPYSPKSGYKYGGLYRIESYWRKKGQDGYLVWRYRLTKLTDSEIIPVADEEVPSPEGETSPRRSNVYSTKVIRSSEVGSYIKQLYDHTCQISGVRLDTPTGPYAEACHIQPVGKPHNGPDVPGNVLCLSPNSHVLFDHGAIALTDDLTILGMDSEINVDPRHHLRIDCMEYHREHLYNG